MATRDGDADALPRERLRVAYRQFWDNAVTLSREIQKSVPGLTLHDEAHFEALWGRADQIAGPGLVLTPLETFALGGAILLHDAANSVAAFPGGMAEIRATPEWCDAATERGLVPDQPLPAGSEVGVLLDALRSLHAQRAETIAAMEVSAGGERFHLLPDAQLRAHLGGLMGLVAASHHWNVSTLASRLPAMTGSLGGMPATWTVRPVLLACLLRCADATQLDQERMAKFLVEQTALFFLGSQFGDGGIALPFGDDPRGAVGRHVEQAGDLAILAMNGRVREIEPGLLLVSVTGHRERLVAKGQRLARERPLDQGTDIAPQLRPDCSGGLAQRPWVTRAEERRVGVIIEEDTLGLPHDAHAVPGREHDADRGPEALRPRLDRAQRGRCPIVPANQFPHRPAAREEAKLVRHSIPYGSIDPGTRLSPAPHLRSHLIAVPIHHSDWQGSVVPLTFLFR